MNRGRQAGFTLLEMLVALVVFGLLMAGLSQTVRYGLKSWSVETRAATGPALLAAADGALRQMIAQAKPDGFTGARDRLAFTTRLPAGSRLGDQLADVALLVSPDHRLLLRWRQHPPGLPLSALPAPQTEPLMDGILAISVSYYVKPSGGPPAWTKAWKNQALPLLVRISFQFSGRQHWPDLVAAPVVAGN